MCFSWCHAARPHVVMDLQNDLNDLVRHDLVQRERLACFFTAVKGAIREWGSGTGTCPT